MAGERKEANNVIFWELWILSECQQSEQDTAAGPTLSPCDILNSVNLNRVAVQN